MHYLLQLVITFLIVYFIMPLLMKIAKKLGFTDKPTKRKKHKEPIPLCGGVGIYIGFFVVYFISMRNSLDKTENMWVFISATLILLIGLVDDYYKTVGKEFPIYPRLIVQLLAAALVFKAGIAFEGFTNPFTGIYVELSYTVQFILTVTWIFGVTTVINWSDGMDGLAGGISLISAMTFFFAAIILGQGESATISIILAGSLIGFLVYNVHPARVFMGDSGANLVGFLLSVIAIDGAFKQATVLSIFIPILALAVPIFDNIFVIYKRFKEGKPVYQADRSQMHFRLAEKGLTINQTVSLILTISFICSAISIFLLLLKN
ncbi:MAG: undecaprenyl/decaprenyl-phosphate alpha-N-acetylglucosaminyl 1-phosphate transferase [Clostridium sp.]|uniref:MraY family glycosyltransferase n=1 Tax=Clostridium sp. DSM 8431 TaxID=1761781 RepID=UPI0008E377A0|nr:MraY family glycosyltransferase [Clostridium sp. DSM 8431]MCR4943014.1 undecaprenyl/decaprenyl-phosphate alpha-N-acetylglucosaminyl 1-phosphate transferase [Clostridium sp.]SFU67989.1 UDP-N-acetylmuramyl pentapeptide phosphotransferase/UDP-N-acetylglucosamine-1-phosphate transferase [Clostridium sp. DSM 8431]